MRLEKQGAVGGLDVAVQVSGASAGPGGRDGQVGGNRGLAGAAFFAGNSDFHGCSFAPGGLLMTLG